MAKTVAKRKLPFEDEDDSDLIGVNDDVPATDRKVSRKHNNPSSDTGEVSSERLKSLVQRIERLEEDKRAVAEDIKDVYSEAKSSGFDTKVIRAIIARRRKEAEEVREFEEILDLYLSALGMI